MKNVWKRLVVFGLILILCMTSITTTQAKKKVKSKSISLEATEVTLSVGDIATLHANMKPTNSTDTITWSSSNKKVAGVNKYGVVTALEEGSAMITARTTSKKTAKCKVIVKKYLSESEITKLIEDKCLAEESIKNLIQNNSLSEENIIALIKQNSIDEETVKELIKQNSIDEETVKELIKQNTLSEEEVKQIVAENGTGTSDVENWEDGTELKLYEHQQFPITLSNYKNEEVTLTNITVKKYHMNEFINGKYCIYRYQIDMDGVTNVNFNDGNYICPRIGCFSKKIGASSAYGYTIYPDSSQCQCEYNSDTGEFHASSQVYNWTTDFDTFYVSNVEIGNKND
ncbi:MAG: Ig domain-containing protein [Roseburia sp.]|nr:Ig domain-containing protein [Roseburia sp.]